jgi:hypothetical protein
VNAESSTNCVENLSAVSSCWQHSNNARWVHADNIVIMRGEFMLTT